MPPMGPIAPFLYRAANEGAFQDMTAGNNNCFEASYSYSDSTESAVCCEHGFEAATGYDVVGGVGSPKFTKLKELALQRKQRYKNASPHHFLTKRVESADGEGSVMLQTATGGEGDVGWAGGGDELREKSKGVEL